MDHRPRVDWLWKSYRRILKKLSKERRYFVMIIIMNILFILINDES